MSQRASGFARKERDLYETPEWVTEAVLPYLLSIKGTIWEPAAGGGQIVRVLERHGYKVLATDLAGRHADAPLMGDFLSVHDAPCDIHAVVTNPPYDLAQEFVEKALALMEPAQGSVAMLLRVDWDSAATRSHLFGKCPQWRQKIVLNRRIVWFEGGASPSFNHAWYIWDWEHKGPPTIGYAA